MSQGSKISVPITILRSEASHLATKGTQTLSGARLVGEIEVRPKEQPRMSLGNYTPTNTPKRFIARISPEPEFDAIVTQITKLGSDKDYELVLHIANYGDTTICAEIWRL
jgi:hypothetical protein